MNIGYIFVVSSLHSFTVEADLGPPSMHIRGRIMTDHNVTHEKRIRVEWGLALDAHILIPSHHVTQHQIRAH